MPLYSAGDDANAKQFRSLHAVQRHMVDTNQCKMLYEDNEDEYADFYDYSSLHESLGGGEAGEEAGEEAGRQLALATSGMGALGLRDSAGFELTVQGGGNGSSSGGGSKALGSRELARYYRQRPKPAETRQSVVVNTIIAQYRSLGVVTADERKVDAGLKRAQKEKQLQQRQWLNLAMQTNINNNLPKNVTF